MRGGSFGPYDHYRALESAWLSRAPAGWATPTFGKCVLFSRNGCAAKQGEETPRSVRVTRIETISGGSINVRAVGFVRPLDMPDRYRLRKGDIQFSNINSLAMIGNCALFNIETELYAGMNLLQIRPNSEKMVPEYLHWQMSSKWFRNRVEASAKPAINQASIPSSSLRQLRVVRPPLPEQTQIAKFLDYETAKIDALIEKQQQLIALLKEKRQAVISHAVTKGLNPDAPMRDSGIEWLGEVPAHWVSCTLRRCAVFVDGDRGSEYPNENDLADEGVPFLSSKNIIDGNLDLSNANFISLKKFDALNRGKALDRDLIVKVRGSTGRIGELAIFDVAACGFETAFINAQMMIIRTNGKLLVGYLGFVSLSCYWTEQLNVGAYGTAQQQLSNKVFRELSVAVPPISEQDEIVRFLEVKIGALGSLEARVKRAVELLHERRTALISAAVTGKIDVRGWSPPVPKPEVEVP